MRTTKGIPTWPVSNRASVDDPDPEMVLTELRRALALVEATFDHSESRQRASREAARIKDAIVAMLESPRIDEIVRLRTSLGLRELAAKLELMQADLNLERSDPPSSGLTD